MRSPAVAARSCCDPGPKREPLIPPGPVGPPGPPAGSGVLPQAASISSAPAPLAEIHQDTAIRRPGRSFHQKVLREQPLTAAIRPHDTDIKGAAFDLGESDQIAARRPY